MIAGFVKTFNVTIDYALYDISYANMLLYMSTIPDYHMKTDKDGKKKNQEHIDADDPANRDKVNKILFG